jgi:hypothetical protein
MLRLLIALYAMWARFPQLHARFPATMTSLTVWGAILVLSVLALVAAA